MVMVTHSGITFESIPNWWWWAHLINPQQTGICGIKKTIYSLPKKAKKKIYIVFKGSYGFIRFMSSDGLHTWRTFQNVTQMPAVNRKTAPSAQFFLFTDSGGGCFEKRSDWREDDTFQSGLPLYRVATNAPKIHTKVPTILAWVLELLIFNFSNLEHHRYETQIHTHIG